MHKILAIALAVASFAALPVLPAQAQGCITHVCGSTDHPSNSGSDSCDASVSMLPRVYPEQVLAIHEQNRVWITPLCGGFDKLSSEGNGLYLKKFIARNPVLVKALSDRGFFPDDVFAVQMMDQKRTANLFVRKAFD